MAVSNEAQETTLIEHKARLMLAGHPYHEPCWHRREGTRNEHGPHVSVDDVATIPVVLARCCWCGFEREATGWL
jgi:hypothetical protein